MRWIVTCFLLVGLAGTARADWREDVDRALAQIAATRADLAVPVDYTQPDTFRLPVVSQWMQAPLDAPGALGRYARVIDPTPRAGGTPSTAIRRALAWLIADPNRIPAPAPAGDVVEGHAPARHAGSWENLPQGARDAVVTALDAMKRGRRERDDLWSAFSKSDRAFVRARACSLLIEEPGIDTLGVFAVHHRETRHVELAGKLFDLLAHLDTASLDAAQARVIFGYEDASARMRTLLNETPVWKFDQPKNGAPRKGPGGVVEGAVAFWGNSDAGAVVVGGPGPNVYRGSFAVIIDPGGDDLYELDGAADGGPDYQWIFDASGDDVYRGRGDGALGSGYFGASVLEDLSGDDLYEASRFSIACGWFGIGLLIDGGGDDRYFSDLASQGAAGFGLGILADSGGDDLYQCRLLSQGFGYVEGVGALLDKAGDDVYLARQEYTDVLRYDDEALTLCQGFGFGERPFASGGIGLLHDLSGNDTYSADVYGQGSAYWWAVGALLDEAGNDHYDAKQYAQGAGIHLALGYLLDGGGKDRYTAWSCAQGCGHDLGTGLLLDMEGTDMYASSDLSQGAGNANGNGILLDLSGADGYLALNGRTSQAYGNPRRETQSLGVLVDLAGHDVHAPHGADASVWTGTTRGVGVDAPAEGPSSLEPSNGVIVPLEDRTFSLDELFVMASAGEPRFREWQARGVKELAEDPTRSIPYLVTKLASPVARERQTVKDIFRLIGAAGVEPLAAALAGADAETKASGAWVLGEMGRPEATPALLALAGDESWHVRSAAFNALGKMRAVDRATADTLRPMLDAALTDTLGSEFVVKDAAFATGALGIVASAPGLCVALGHPSLRVRHAAEAALIALGTDAAPAVEASARRTAAGDGAAGVRRAPHLLAVAGAWGGRSGEIVFSTIEKSALWADEAVKATGRESLEAWVAREGKLPPSLVPILAELRGDRDWMVRERRDRDADRANSLGSGGTRGPGGAGRSGAGAR